MARPSKLGTVPVTSAQASRRPQTSPAAGAEQPLVAAGDQEVAAEGGNGLRLDPEGVDGVGADQHPVGGVAVPVVPGHGRADLGQGSFTAGARVDSR